MMSIAQIGLYDRAFGLLRVVVMAGLRPRLGCLLRVGPAERV